ncbi:pilin [Candidatus Parcubacteria bacterium]|nr:pilin [Candidatus Parcubacteria bacterium]
MKLLFKIFIILNVLLSGVTFTYALTYTNTDTNSLTNSYTPVNGLNANDTPNQSNVVTPNTINNSNIAPTNAGITGPGSAPAISTPGNLEYTPLAPLPGTTNGPCSVLNTTDPNCKATVESYIPGLYKLLIGIAGVFAIVMITFGGIQYMSSEAIGGKEAAKARINGAIWGLVLVVSSALILLTIDPRLLNLNLNIEAPPVAAQITDDDTIQYTFSLTSIADGTTRQVPVTGTKNCESQRTFYVSRQGTVYRSIRGCYQPQAAQGKTFYCFDLYKGGQPVTIQGSNCFAEDGTADAAWRKCQEVKTEWEGKYENAWNVGACTQQSS